MKLRMKKRRERLFQRQGGRCYWCYCEMTMSGYSGKQPRTVPNLATIDHLDDRFTQERGRQEKGKERTVVACWRCNNDRAKERQAAQPIETLWFASGRMPANEAQQ